LLLIFNELDILLLKGELDGEMFLFNLDWKQEARLWIGWVWSE